MFKISLTVMGVAALLLSSLHPSLADQVHLPLLRSSIVVSGDTISLADLMEGTNLPNNGVYAAPAPGQTGIIKSSRILEAAGKAGIPSILGDVSGNVTVTRKGRLILPEEIEAELKKTIREKTGIDQVQLTFTKPRITSDIFVEDDVTTKPIISNLKIEPSNLSFTATLTVPGSRVFSTAPLMLEGQIVDVIDVALSTRAIAKGDILSANDIRIEKRERKAIAANNVTKPTLVIGQAAREPLSPGIILTDDLVSKPILVEKAMAVSVTYAVGGLKLTLRGKANEAGALGDMISVLNPQSKKVIFATVIGPGSVAVLTPPNADIASRQTTTTVQ
jgi:flagella basal body P-ring formation protein FlgA